MAIERRAVREGMLLAVATLACLAPFADKPFHIDDPVYVWVAEHIARSPLDFYGLELQWYGSPAPVYEFNKNPPLVSFWLAGAGVLVGFGERAMHAAMALVGFAAIAGVHALARVLGLPALLAALVALASAGVLVSATTVMSDLLMLALALHAVALWVAGLEARSGARLCAAASLAGLAPLAKYFGVAVLPLLALIALLRERRLGTWTGALAIPLAMVGGYELYMRARYGVGPLADVGGYALGFEKTPVRFAAGERLLVGLAFAGGALLPQALLAPWLWSGRALAAQGALALALLALAFALPSLGDFPLRDADGLRLGYVLQLALFAWAGAHLLALGAAEAIRARDATALLLLGWLLGVFVFASFTNWVPNVRAVLPAAPAAALLVARRLAARGVAARGALFAPVAIGLSVALLVARADQDHAVSARDAARALALRHGAGPGRLFFQGSWGFQYYMQAQGVPKLDPVKTELRAGDRVIAPANNSNVVFLPETRARTIAVERFPSSRLAAVQSKPGGAGFYAALWGPLPFVLGPAPPERYLVYEVTP